MATHEHSVVVDRPITMVYDQWTQFESYPAFMDNVAAVEQLDDALTHWKVSVAGVEREYDAQILEQRPGEVIAWQSLSGPRQAGRVSFAPLDADRTRVTLRLDFEPHGITENVGETVGVVAASVEDSLERFKDFIEDRGAADGGWRGTIVDGVPLRGVDPRRPEPFRSAPGPGTTGDVPVDLRGPGVPQQGSADDVRDLS